MEKAGFKLEYRLDLQKEFVNGDDNDILLSGNVKQFPCGIGGIDEVRKDSEGKRSKRINLHEHHSHLSLMSRKEFQEPLFQLVMHSMFAKLRTLDNSRLHLRDPVDSKRIAQGLNADDLRDCIKARRSGRYGVRTRVSKKLLNAIDSTARALPHTNAAAKQARYQYESMMHHFGMPHIFFTVAFDDQASFLLQVLTGVEIDDGENPAKEGRCKDIIICTRCAFGAAAAVLYRVFLLRLYRVTAVATTPPHENLDEKPVDFVVDVHQTQHLE